MLIFPYLLKHMEILSAIVSHAYLFKARSISNTCTRLMCRAVLHFFSFSFFFCGAPATENLSLQSEELSLGPPVGGVFQTTFKPHPVP